MNIQTQNSSLRFSRFTCPGHKRSLHSLIGAFLVGCRKENPIFLRHNTLPFMDLRGKITGYHPPEDINYETNPWDNYFDQPIPDNKEIYFSEAIVDGSIPIPIGKNSSNTEYSKIAEKYLRIKQHIIDKAESFISDNFCHDTVGIHIRGTDSFYDTTRAHVPLGFYIDMIHEKFADISKIFLSTDSELTRSEMKKIFPNKIIHWDSDLVKFKDNQFNTGIVNRSYKAGEDALIESILLSRCQKLIRTKSNLTTYSLVLNPNIDNHVCDLKFHNPRHMLYSKINFDSPDIFYDVNLEPSTMKYHLERSEIFESKKFELLTSMKFDSYRKLDELILEYIYGHGK